jgi:hypothetical protein
VRADLLRCGILVLLRQAGLSSEHTVPTTLFISEIGKETGKPPPKRLVRPQQAQHDSDLLLRKFMQQQHKLRFRVTPYQQREDQGIAGHLFDSCGGRRLSRAVHAESPCW